LKVLVKAQETWLLDEVSSLRRVASCSLPEFENNYTEMCSGTEAGSYLRPIDFVYHSPLGLRVIKKKTWLLDEASSLERVASWSVADFALASATNPP